MREVILSDANNKDYCRWMNDRDVTQYTESDFQHHTVRTLRSYIKQVNNSNSVFFAIVLKNGNRHIGNIKIGPISQNHSFANVGIIIGDKTFWGKGYGIEAIKLAVNYAFHQLNLHKLAAYVHARNTSSIQAFKKAGFTEEGRQRQHLILNGEFVDRLILGIINPE